MIVYAIGTGIEAHVCVMQTALDLREKGFDVHLIADATSSQQPSDRFYAFEVCMYRSISMHFIV